MTQLEEKISDIIFKSSQINREDFPGFNEYSTIYENDNVPDGNISLGLDSIDSLEIIVEVENEWNLPEIQGEDIVKMRTVKGIADYLIKQGIQNI